LNFALKDFYFKEKLFIILMNDKVYLTDFKELNELNNNLLIEQKRLLISFKKEENIKLEEIIKQNKIIINKLENEVSETLDIWTALHTTSN